MADHVAAVAALDEPNRRKLYDFVVRQTAPISKDEASAAIGLPRTTAGFHLDKLVEMYTGFGFQPLSIKRLGTWLAGAFTPIDGWWWVRRGNDFKTLAGWLVMTMLLSLGAPFWHDALQSLFGVKNLLQKKNEQRNVEQKRGAGNPAT